MNGFDEILKTIGKDYPVRKMTSTYAQIEFDILFDFGNYVFIGVLSREGEALLTDMADYSQLDYWDEEDLPEVERICGQYGVRFHNWHIERPYQSNEDVQKFLDCILALKERFVGDE